jgi:hypothetical protein
VQHLKRQTIDGAISSYKIVGEQILGKGVIVMRWLKVGCGLAVLVVAVTAGFGQQVGPKFLDRSFQRPGARALGMGGAYLLATDDATAVAWNPAALVNVKRFTLPIEVAGRTNLDVRDVTDLIDDLETIRDQTNVADPAAVIAAIQNAFNRVQGFARRKPVMHGSLAPVGGLSFGSYGLTISSGIVLQADSFVDTNGQGQFGLQGLPNPNLYVRGGALALTSIGVAYARPFPAGLTIGATVRRIRADFAGFLFGATTNDAAPDPVIGQAFDRVDRSRFTLDVGALWEPPVQPPMVKVKYAAVVRNLLPVRFKLPAVDLAGNPVAGFDFSFRLNPEIDLGVLAEWKGRTNLVFELHNVTSSNGGDMSIHAGVEHWLAGDVFAVRVGYDDDKPVFGLGINLKVLRIDLAAGFKPKERAAVGISLRF